MPAGNYNNQRYSKLEQINQANIKEMTMSQRELRGHEGNVLAIDDTMYVHTPFPNIVFALKFKQ